MLLHVNQELDLNQENLFWAKNGATRRTLIVVNKLHNRNETSNKIYCSIGYLDKGNHSFIFINEPKTNENRILGLYLNNLYSYTLVSGKEIYSNLSQGGYGNSCSKFGLYEVGTILKVHSYKNRQSAEYVELTKDGWIPKESYEVEAEITEVM